jgi:error-prone DNA polymerase
VSAGEGSSTEGGDAYVPLWVKSNYSFLEGSSHPDELMARAQLHGLGTLALTDRDGVYGVVRAHVAGQESGVRVLIGSEVTLFDGTSLLLYAMNRAGYAQLCQLLSSGRRRCQKGESRVSYHEVCAGAGGVLAVLPFDRSVLLRAQGRDYQAPLQQLSEAFGDALYAMVARHREASDRKNEQQMRARAAEFSLPVVAGVEVLYHCRARRELQDVMTCIRHGVTLATAGRRIRCNDEHALPSPSEFAELFHDDPCAVDRTVEIADRCRFSLSQIRYRYPSERLPDGSTSSSWLRDLTYRGAEGRYSAGIPDAVVRQLELELAVIHDLEYDGYFLTMYEIVRFCRERGILCQGRGSAANSAVCYCLGITAIDPVQMQLLFERFLSKERAEPPDIDLDIEHARREEVIQHVYDKYGRSHAAMVANFIRFRTRSAIREIGKVLGLTETSIDRLARRASHSETVTKESLAEVGGDSLLHERLRKLCVEIQDMPRHLSIHPGGFLLGHERVDALVPIENATMPDRTVIQWDKNDLESLGLFKVDLLGLGSLHVVHLAFDLIQQHCGERWTLATIPQDDAPTYEMIRAADTIGVFQIESRAQMAMLPRMQPRNYYDLVVEVSIVRPGPIHGGMVHPYLRRRMGQEPVTYPHPSLEPVLKRTYGIPLFQEQVMQIAVYAADYTPGEADQLRRDMAAWRQAGRIEQHQERFVSRMIEKGVEPDFAERVFEQIRGFGEYGFPESHAASFALIAYATSWLKCHYPSAFLCALLNAQPMGFYMPSTLVDDAKRHGVEVLPVDVCRSEQACTLEPSAGSGEGFAVRMGLSYIKGLRRADIDLLLSARPYTGLRDFERRVMVQRGVLELLAQAGALNSLRSEANGISERRDILWHVLGSQPDCTGALDLPVAEDTAAFDPLTDFEAIRWDYEHSSHSTRGHPLAAMREQLRDRNLPDAAAIRCLPDGRRVHYAGLVISRQRPSAAKGVVFMTLEDETGFVNLVLWGKVFDQFRSLAKTVAFLGVTGEVQAQSGVVHVIVERLWDPKVAAQPRKVRSRDFH